MHLPINMLNFFPKLHHVYDYEISIMANLKFGFCNLPILLRYIIVIEITEFQCFFLTVTVT